MSLHLNVYEPPCLAEESREWIERARAGLTAGDMVDLSAMDGHPIWTRWRSTKRQCTWLHVAPTLTRHAETVLPFLVAQGIDPEARNSLGATPLHFSFSIPGIHRETWLSAWAAVGVDPHAIDIQGRSAWYHAFRAADVFAVEWLAGTGSRPLEADWAGLGAGSCLHALETIWRACGPPPLSQRVPMLIRACKHSDWPLAQSLLGMEVEAGLAAHVQEALAWACSRSGSGPPSTMQAQVVRQLVAEGAQGERIQVNPRTGKPATVWEMTAADNKTHLRQSLREGQREFLQKNLPPAAALKGPRF